MFITYLKKMNERQLKILILCNYINFKIKMMILLLKN